MAWPPREGLPLQRSQDLSSSPRLTLQELLFVPYSLLLLYLPFLFPEKLLHPQPLPAGKTLLILQEPHMPPLLDPGWGGGPHGLLHCIGLGMRTDGICPSHPSHHPPSPTCNALIVDTGSSLSPLKPSQEACTSRKPSVLNLACTCHGKSHEESSVRCPRDTACSGLFMPQT